MGDTRVHPAAIGVPPPPPPPSEAVPPPVTYVFQLPREQIFRYPPPENATKFQPRSHRRTQRSCFRRCCCCTLCLLLLLAVAVAVSAGALHLVFRFRSPSYAVTSLAISGINATTVSPRFVAAIRAENPNRKVGIHYLRHSSVVVYFNGVRLSGGTLPAFYQPRKNVTVLRTALTGSGVVLGGAVRTALRNARNQRRIPFVVRFNVPVKIEVGSVTTWKIAVKVKCNVVVDALTERARILSRNCDYSVRLW